VGEVVDFCGQFSGCISSVDNTGWFEQRRALRLSRFAGLSWPCAKSNRALLIGFQLGFTKEFE